MKSAAASFDSEAGFGQTQDFAYKNDGSGGNSIMYMATSGTPMGNYATASASHSMKSKNYTNVNFSSGNSRPRNYQSRYRTQAL